MIFQFTSRRITRSSKSRLLAPKAMNSACGPGSAMTIGMVFADLQQDLADLFDVDAVGDADGKDQRGPTRLPRVQFVTCPLTRSAFGMMTSVRSKVSIRVDRTRDVAHEAHLAVDLDHVAFADGAFDQQDDAGHEVLHDGLQAETDADGQGAGDDGKARQVDPRRGDRDQRRQEDADIADTGGDGVLPAQIHPRARQDRGLSCRLTNWVSR